MLRCLKPILALHAAVRCCGGKSISSIACLLVHWGNTDATVRPHNYVMLLWDSTTEMERGFWFRRSSLRVGALLGLQTTLANSGPVI